MSRIYILTLFVALTLIPSFGQADILKLVKNNRELSIPNHTDFAAQEQKLNAVLNKYHDSYPLHIRVQFIDKREQAVLEGWLEWMGLVDNRYDIDPNACNDIEILFEWSGSSWNYKGIEFDQSNIIEKYFLPEVKSYVLNNFQNGQLNNESDIIAKWLKIITNVLDQEYKEAILKEGEEMVHVKGYVTGHRLAHWMPYGYQYDLSPYLVDSAKAETTPYITNKDVVYTGYYYYMPTILKMFENFKYHNPNKKVSEIDKGSIWTSSGYSRGNWGKKIPSYILTDKNVKLDTEFKEKEANDTTRLYRLKVEKIPIGDNEKYNFMSDLGIYGWIHTSCNFFAFDLQKNVYGYYLWPLSCAQGSSAIADYLPTDANFVEVPKGKAYEFAQAGFLVVAVKSGHVTSLYPNGELFTVNEKEVYSRVTQAGSYVGNQLFLNEIWRSESSFKEVKTYVFLGYIML